MARSLTSTDRTLLGARNYGLYVKVEAANQNGTLIDLSSWVTSVDIDNSLDNGAATCTLTLIRESGNAGTQSLAPFLSTSTLNRNNSAAYAPLLNPNRVVIISIAVMTPGGAPGGGDWKVLFNGLTDDVNWGQTPLTVQLRDGVKRLLDTQIEITRSYGAPTPGIAAEVVMQSIIDDNVSSPPALVLGPTGSPAWFLLPYAQDTVKVYEAIRALAMQIGWDVRMRWSGTLERLTFYQPDRAKTTPDFILGPSEYVSIPSLSINDDGIRNVIEIIYVDAITHTPTSIIVSDSASVTAFGRRYMLIGEAATSSIDTSAEATAMATAALSDLALPRAAQDMEMTFFWPIELGDLIGFSANSVHYDAQQNLAVSSYHHHLENGAGTTTIRTSGKPAGAYARWLTLGSPSAGGLIPNFPEFLFVNAPTEVTAAGSDGAYQIVGWKIAGRVDTDTSAVIITLSSSLGIRATSPDFTQVPPLPAAATEWWLPVTPGGFFTIEVYLLQGGAGQVTLVPASTFNPTATTPPPRGGVLGGAFVQTLSRTPVTTISTTQPSATSFGVTLSVRPLTATIKYRFAPNALVGTEPWVAVTDPQGSTTFLVDVSGAPVMLEYYGVSTDLVSEEVHSMRLDQGTSADIVSVFAAETAPNILTASFILTDDVVSWKLFARLGDYPDRPTLFAEPFEEWLKFTGNRQKTEVSFYAVENTGVPWYVEVHGYDLYGAPGREETYALYIDGPLWGTTTPGAITGLFAGVVNEGGPNFIDLTWANNGIIEAAAASRFTVTIRENGVAVATNRQAKLDHLGTDTIAGFGGWHRAVTPAAVGAPGAAFATFQYEVDLWDSSVYVATYAAVTSGWFTVASTGTAPTATPPTPVVTTGYPSSVALQADWGAVIGAVNVEIEWHSSTDAFVANDVIFMSEVMAPGTLTHTARGFVLGQTGRCRIRYTNAFGVGPWTIYSNALASGGPPTP